MNKNKIIFALIGVALVIGLLFLVITLKNSSSHQTTSVKTTPFTVWILGDDRDNFLGFVEQFKKIKTNYAKNIIDVESFSNYEEYYSALSRALTQGKGPDIFVLNNGEKTSLFADQTLPIGTNIMSADDFRKKYKGVFNDDLILTATDNGKQTEYLAGIPVGYETLGIYYNRRYVNSTDLSSLSTLNNIVSKLKEKNPGAIPIGMGNGTSVYGASDIITQFFMLETGVTKLADLVSDKVKQSLAGYLLYGDQNGDNNYNSRFLELKNTGQNNLNLFSKGDVFMIVGYPRMLAMINQNGFSKSFLRASPFPHYFSGEGKTLLNYNYFVINKTPTNLALASDFLAYLTTDAGVTSYLTSFPYYLPALISLEADKLDAKIDPDYGIVLKDFYNPDFELASFDKGIKSIYDREIISILDNPTNSEIQFDTFKKKLLCKAQKLITLQDLSKDCDTVQ